MSLNVRKTINATFTALLEFIEPLSSAETNIVNSKYYIGTKESDNKKHYYPGLSSDTDTISYNGKIYSYNSGFKTIFFKAPGGTIYRLPNVESSSYDIPAGTYTPSAFRNLIEQFISNNGNRTVSNTFTAKVNGQTITVNSGSKIYYQVLSSSPQGNARSVYFGKAPESGIAPAIISNNSVNGFTNGKAYVVYNAGGGFFWTQAYINYANYSITIGTGINFS